jgi:hypothetical protein
MADQLDEQTYANIVSSQMSKMLVHGEDTIVSLIKGASPDIISYLTSVNVDMRAIAVGADGYLFLWHAAQAFDEKWEALFQYYARFFEMTAKWIRPQKALYITCDVAAHALRTMHEDGAEVCLLNGRHLLYFERFINKPGSPTFIPEYTVYDWDDIFLSDNPPKFDLIYTQLPVVDEHWDNLNRLIDCLNPGATMTLGGAGIDGASVYAPNDAGFEQHPLYLLHSRLKQRNDICIYNFPWVYGVTAICKL